VTIVGLICLVFCRRRMEACSPITMHGFVLEKPEDMTHILATAQGMFAACSRLNCDLARKAPQLKAVCARCCYFQTTS
jgi:hypothetical protein